MTCAVSLGNDRFVLTSSITSAQNNALTDTNKGSACHNNMIWLGIIGTVIGHLRTEQKNLISQL